MAETDQVWVVDDDESIRWVLEKALQRAGMRSRLFSDAHGLLEALEHSRPSVVVADIRMPNMDGLRLLDSLKAWSPELPVIIMTAHSDLETAVSAYRGGAFEYLPKPFDINDAVALVRRAGVRAEEPGIRDKERPAAAPEIIGEAAAMQEVFRAIGRLSRSNITVLINGQSGTGKELVARALHRHSPRAGKEFIALNMAAIPRDLLESELFGHERGAFTGAQSSRRGRFEQANLGTLFLDEIGDMPAELQTRLLRVLAEGEFYRVGGHTPVRVDVRVIAATHQNLEERVEQGAFREDLYHRLNVIRIHVPSLRERVADIPLLLRHFLQTSAHELEVEPKSLHGEVETYLCQLEWRGNVRQLENLCRWLTVMASGHEVLLQDLPPEIRTQSKPRQGESDWERELRRWVDQSLAQGDSAILEKALPAFERVLIEAALSRTRGRRQDAAQLIGWGRNTLTRKVKELRL
jgi:two-component system nitrogen regulation response regulator GlnG